MIAGGRGLIVHTGHYGAVSYHQGPPTGRRRREPTKMAADLARELRPYGVAAVSIWMGGLDTERVPRTTRTPCRRRRVTCGASRPSSPDG